MSAHFKIAFSHLFPHSFLKVDCIMIFTHLICFEDVMGIKLVFTYLMQKGGREKKSSICRFIPHTSPTKPRFVQAETKNQAFSLGFALGTGTQSIEEEFIRKLKLGADPGLSHELSCEKCF